MGKSPLFQYLQFQPNLPEYLLTINFVTMHPEIYYFQCTNWVPSVYY